MPGDRKGDGAAGHKQVSKEVKPQQESAAAAAAAGTTWQGDAQACDVREQPPPHQQHQHNNQPGGAEHRPQQQDQGQHGEQTHHQQPQGLQPLLEQPLQPLPQPPPGPQLAFTVEPASWLCSMVAQQLAQQQAQAQAGLTEAPQAAREGSHAAASGSSGHGSCNAVASPQLAVMLEKLLQGSAQQQQEEEAVAEPLMASQPWLAPSAQASGGISCGVLYRPLHQ
jgi:hypothetical protein